MFKRSLLSVLAVICTATASMATSYMPRTDLGIACLDEKTGELLWEYFPDKLGFCELATDGEFLHMVEGPTRRYLMDPFIDATDKIIFQAVDLKTLTAIEDVSLPDLPTLKLQLRSPWEMVTSSGLRVAGSTGNDRVISILKPIEGKPDVLVRTIDTDGFFANPMVIGNLVIYSKYRSRNKEGEPLPHLIAIDARTGAEAWTLSINCRIWGIGRGSKHLLVCEHEGLVFVDPATGAIVRRTSLPRIRGWTTVAEENGRVYVACDYLSGPPSYYLYCIDRDSGKVQWTFDPGGSLVRLPILVNDGKVYTQIAPTRLFSWWHSNPRGNDEAFLSKSLPAMELHFRAWHRLGDRSALPVMNRLSSAIDDERLRGVVEELIQTFPRHRDMQAFIQYLREWHDLHPKDKAEVLELLEHTDPVPVWLRSEKIGFPPQPAPKFPLSSEKQALIDFYRSFRKELDPTYGGTLDKNNFHWFGSRQPPMPFPELLAAYHAAEDQHYKLRILGALFRHYPKDATAWADDHLGALDSDELQIVVSNASLEWLAKDAGRLAEWLSKGDKISQRIVYRLRELEPGLAERLCVEFLENHEAQEWGLQVHLNQTCIRLLGQLKACDRHGPLLLRYLTSNVTMRDVLDRFGDAERIRPRFVLRKEAADAFRACGVEKQAVLYGDEEIVGPEEDRKVLVARRRARDLHQQMCQFNDSDALSKARDAARKLVIELDGVGGDFYKRDEFLADAFMTLERWDELIAHCRKAPTWMTERNIFDVLSKAQQFNKLERYILVTGDSDVALDGAFALIELDRLDGAKQTLFRLVESNPNDANAYIALALAYKAEGRWQEADVSMTHATALRPIPYADGRFHHTITYWLDRGKPEEARKWLNESATRDYGDWRDAGLFDWAAQYNELRDTVNQIRQQHGDPPIARCGTTGVLWIVVGIALLGISLWRRRIVNSRNRA